MEQNQHQTMQHVTHVHAQRLSRMALLCRCTELREQLSQVHSPPHLLSQGLALLYTVYMHCNSANISPEPCAAYIKDMKLALGQSLPLHPKPIWGRTPRVNSRLPAASSLN
jgi:hypothetical protein